MPGAGLEPARPEGHPILSRARLTSSATPAGYTVRADVTDDTRRDLRLLGPRRCRAAARRAGRAVGRPRAARRPPPRALGLRALGRLRRRLARHRRQPLLLRDRR